jgi:tRNA (guanine-N(7)-)-methyltransferase subunit TRM82
LISGGGDPFLKIWDWMTGHMKHEFRVLDAIQPYMVVRSKKRKRGDDGDNGTEGGRRKGKKKKGKTQNGGATYVDTINDGMEELPLLDTNVGPERGPDDTQPQGSGGRGELILVVHKISTVASESGKYIVFNAVGYVLMQLQWSTDADTPS